MNRNHINKSVTLTKEQYKALKQIKRDNPEFNFSVEVRKATDKIIAKYKCDK